MTDTPTHSFLDSTGHKWSVVIDVNALKRVRRDVDLDLGTFAGGELLQRIAADPVLLVDLLYVVLRPQAERDGVSDAEFGSRIGGDVFDHATSAFVQALIDFFPQPRRAALGRLWEKHRQVEAAIADRAVKMLATGGAIDLLLSESESSTYGGASMNSPELSALTPAP